MEVTELLRRLGFAEYEARAYVALLRRSPLNGYEAAKLSGVPRADIYSVLQRLEERGAALRLDTEGGTRYAPVPPADVLARLQARFEEAAEAARRSLEEVEAPPEYEYVGNARGYELLLEHARALVDGARRQLLIALGPRESEALAEELSRAEARGVEITTLCLHACPEECGHCRGRVHRHRVAPEDSARWLVLVPDQSEVLAGEVGDDGEALAVRTRQPLLVGLSTWYLRHSIALATQPHLGQ